MCSAGKRKRPRRCRLDIRFEIGYTRRQEAINMTDKEQIAMVIDVYTDLQRIANAPDRDKEINNQLKKARIKLEVFGIAVDDLKME